MRKEKVRIQGSGIVTCISQWEALKRIKNLDESTWVKKLTRELAAQLRI